MSAKITKKMVEAISPPPIGRLVIFDSEISGFGVRVTPNGTKTFVLKYSMANKARWYTIGSYPAFSADEARREALAQRGAIARGDDPASYRLSQKIGDISFEEFASQYLQQHADLKKRARSREEDKRNLKKHINPALGKLKISEVTPLHIQRLHQKMSDTPFAANRCLALVSTILNKAEAWGYRQNGSNPARHIEKYPEKPRDRIVTAAEIGRIGKALRHARRLNVLHPSAIACIELLILTGCRLQEILTLKWSFVDFERSSIHLPVSKTGTKTVLIGDAALSLLKSLPHSSDCEYVLPGKVFKTDRKTHHYVGIEKNWQCVRKVACLKDLRIHDLRHAFAQVGASGGESLQIIGRLLGHSNPTITNRYANLAPDPVQRAATRISSELANRLAGKPLS